MNLQRDNRSLPLLNVLAIYRAENPFVVLAVLIHLPPFFEAALAHAIDGRLGS